MTSFKSRKSNCKSSSGGEEDFKKKLKTTFQSSFVGRKPVGLASAAERLRRWESKTKEETFLLFKLNKFVFIVHDTHFKWFYLATVLLFTNSVCELSSKWKLVKCQKLLISLFGTWYTTTFCAICTATGFFACVHFFQRKKCWQYCGSAKSVRTTAATNSSGGGVLQVLSSGLLQAPWNRSVMDCTGGLETCHIITRYGRLSSWNCCCCGSVGGVRSSMHCCVQFFDEHTWWGWWWWW